MKASSHTILLIIIGIAMLLRTVFLVMIPQDSYYSPPLYYGDGGDAAEYSAIAEELASGHGYSLHNEPTSARPPLYPVMLSGIYRLAGNGNLLAVRIVQIILAIAGLTIFWKFTKDLTERTEAAHLATLILAVHPRFIAYNLAILTETLFWFLILCTLAYAKRWLKTQQPKDAAIALMIATAASFTRPTAFPFTALTACWMVYAIWRSGDRDHASFWVSRAARAVLPGLVLLAVATGGWMARNEVQLGHFSFSSLGGGAFAEAWDRTILAPMGISDRDILEPLKNLDAQEFASAGYRVFFAEIAKDPFFIAGIAWKKFLYWMSPSARLQNSALSAIQFFITLCIFCLGAAGLWKYARGQDRHMAFLFLLLFASFTAIHVLTIPYHRYRFPVIDVYLVMFASYAVVELWNKAQEQNWRMTANNNTSLSPSSERRDVGE